MYKHVFIVTYGRSGSTLLNGVLNSIDGFNILGENENFLFPIYNSFKRLSSARNRFKTHNTRISNHSWYGIERFDEEVYLKEVNNLAYNSFGFNKNEVNGFKEIRYFDIGEELDGYLNFISRVFPSSAFIFNFRDHNQVSNSSWWKNKSGIELQEFLEELTIFENRCTLFAKEKENCFIIEYTDIIEKNDNLVDMFRFLGQKYDNDRISNVLSCEFSSGNNRAILGDINRFKPLSDVLISNLSIGLYVKHKSIENGLIIIEFTKSKIKEIKTDVNELIDSVEINLNSPWLYKQNDYNDEFKNIRHKLVLRLDKIENLEKAIISSQSEVLFDIKVINKDLG